MMMMEINYQDIGVKFIVFIMIQIALIQILGKCLDLQQNQNGGKLDMAQNHGHRQGGIPGSADVLGIYPGGAPANDSTRAI